LAPPSLAIEAYLSPWMYFKHGLATSVTVYIALGWTKNLTLLCEGLQTSMPITDMPVRCSFAFK